MCVPDEGYSRNILCALNLISAFLFQRNFNVSEKQAEEEVKMKKEEASMMKLATCKWFEAKSPEGYSYYWNTETNGINLTVFLPQA
jgi:hypothetical protein